MAKEIVEVYKEDLVALFEQKEYYKKMVADLKKENRKLAAEAEIGVLAENKKLSKENEYLKKELARLEKFCGGILKDLVKLESKIDGTLKQSKKYLSKEFVDLAQYLDEIV